MVLRASQALLLACLVAFITSFIGTTARCETIVWSTGDKDRSGPPKGQLLSDNADYWGECVLTSVARKEEPLSGDDSRRFITFDFKRPCAFSEVVIFVNNTAGTPLKIEVLREGQKSWEAVLDRTLPASPPERLIVHRLPLAKARGRYMRITAPNSTAILDSNNVWVWGDGEVSEKYPEFINRSFRPDNRATAPDSKSWDGTVDVPKGSYISVPGIEKTVFTGEQLRQWRDSIGGFNRKPAVWSKQSTFGSITHKPLLAAIEDIKTQIEIETTRREKESVAIA